MNLHSVERSIHMSNCKKNKPIYDLHIFADPLDEQCLHCITQLEELVPLDSCKVYSQLYLFTNFKTVDNYLKRQQLPINNLSTRNLVHKMAYTITLLYTAISLQGKKKAFQFIQQLQPLIQQNNFVSFNELIEAARKVDVDIDMLLNDYQTDAVKQLYENSQKYIHYVQSHPKPSFILYDSQAEIGILVEDISIDSMRSLLIS